MSNNKPLDSVSATETVEIGNGLSLAPRVRLDLTLFPASPSVTKPVDEWKLKRTLIEYLKTSLSVSVVVPEEDLHFRRVKDPKKRKRDDPLALGSLFIRDLGFLDATSQGTALDDKFLEWRTQIVEKLDGIELNIEGFKYRLNVAVPASDDFESMKKEWEEFYVTRNPGFSRNVKQEPDTIVLRGVPSRWFAEPRVSSKPSLLVTHTIFSTFGGIKNLNVGEDENTSKDESEDGADIISGLHCKIVVQFETHKDFYNTLKVLCCRSMQKQGSKLWADYEVSWDRDGIFRNLPSQSLEKNRVREKAPEYHRSEAPRRQQYVSRFSSDDIGRKRFKE